MEHLLQLVSTMCLRTLMISRIKAMLENNPKDGMRFGCIFESMYRYEKGIQCPLYYVVDAPNPIKEHNKLFKQWDQTKFDFEKLSDLDLLYLFERITNRFYAAM